MQSTTHRKSDSSARPSAFDISKVLSFLSFTGFIIAVLITLALGWRLRHYELITAERGTGYALGIVGGCAFLLLLVYPLRKRVKALRQLGTVRAWFRLHMILGILAPLIILFHANFRPGSLNSTVALVCMLVVASSGLIGRYAYAKIHIGLYGTKTDVERLRQSIEIMQKELAASSGYSRDAREQIEETCEAVDTEPHSLWQGIGRRRRINRLTREIRRSAGSPWRRGGPGTTDRHRRTLLRDFATAAERCGDFFVYQRVFSWWHFAHLPLFFMLVLAAIIHVIAVHMY